MVWQVLAMWTIVIATITWFVRDERRLRHEAMLVKAAAYYAHAPKYRHVVADAAEPAPAPAPRVGGLSEAQRKVLRGMLR